MKNSLRVVAAVAMGLWLAGTPRIFFGEGSAPANCGTCRAIKPVNTSEHPSKGRVYEELDRQDLETIFSNRDAVYGSWEDADLALRQAIDPDGSLHISTGAAPHPRTTDVKLEEGWASRMWIKGPGPAPSPETVLAESRERLRRALQSSSAKSSGQKHPIQPRPMFFPKTTHPIPRLQTRDFRARAVSSPGQAFMAIIPGIT